MQESYEDDTTVAMILSQDLTYTLKYFPEKYISMTHYRKKQWREFIKIL
jgi:hypothetical protein